MRRLFTVVILVIAVVFAAFADTTTSQAETHTIKMKTIVAGNLPAFQLRFIEQVIPTVAVGNEDLSLLTASSLNTNASGDSWKAGESYSDASTVIVPDISQHNVDVTFGAVLANSSQRMQARKYTMTFTAGDFTVTRNKVANLTHSATTYEVTYLLSGVEYATVSDVATNAATSDAFSVLFPGKYQENVSDGALLAKFHAVYPKDASIDPNGTTGYEASVTLTIVAEY